MAFCKVCDCSNIIVFQRRLAFPPRCPECGRTTANYETFQEDDPGVQVRLQEVREKLLREGAILPDDVSADTQTTTETPVEPAGEVNLGSGSVRYFLVFSNGAEIPIPEAGCIVGRTENGGEELAEYGSVSRQHVRIVPRRQSGVTVEDLSTYGTWVDGRKLEKNIPVRAKDGAKIILCNLEATLVARNS